jgi:hypothetical protein
MSRYASPALTDRLIVELLLYVDFPADSTYKSPNFRLLSPEKLGV